MSLLRSSAALTASNLVVRFGSYVYRILMGRLLSPYEFGLLNLALPLQFLVVVLASSGIAPSVARFIARENARSRLRLRDEIAASALLYYTLGGVLLGAAFVLLAPAAARIFREPELVQLLRIAALALPFGFALAALSGILQGLGRFGTLAALLTAQQAGRILFALALVVLLSDTATSAILGSTLGFALALVLALLLLRSSGIALGRRSLDTFREVFLFSLPVSLTSVAAFALAYVDILLLGIFLPPQEVGVYSAASPTARLPLAFAMALSAVLLPKVAAGGEVRRQVANAYMLLLPVLGAATLVTLVFAEPIVTLLFGYAYAEASTPLRILALGSFFYGFFSVNSGVLQGLGKAALPMKILGAAALLDLLLNLLLIPLFAATGAAVASALSLAFAGLASTLAIRALVR
jgi:stage V sporulation protein B